MDVFIALLGLSVSTSGQE